VESRGAVVCWGIEWENVPRDVRNVSGTASAIAAGGMESCAIQAGTGKVFCWGRSASPPLTVNGAAWTASAIATGDTHSCAIPAETGGVVCWGNDSSGQVMPPGAVAYCPADADACLGLGYVGGQRGFSVSTAGDVDNDTFDDVVVGVREYNGNAAVSRVEVYFGSANGILPDDAWKNVDEPTQTLLGNYSVAAAGDVDGDTFDDIVVGEPEYDTGCAENVGRIRVYYGAVGRAPAIRWPARAMSMATATTTSSSAFRIWTAPGAAAAPTIATSVQCSCSTAPTTA